MIARNITHYSLRKALAITTVSSALFFQMGVTVASAQTVNIVDPNAPLLATPSSASTAPVGSPLPSPSPENKELANLREKYKTDLSIYRTDERDFQLAREQFNKLQTLASLEVSVKATRKVMISRAIVLQDYIQILNLIVRDTAGIDVNEKTELLKQLTTINTRLKTHQQLAEQAIDRASVQNVAADFATFSADVSKLSFKSMSYINYGRLQTVYDKMISVRDEVSSQFSAQESNGLKLGEKRRALDEINRNLEVTKANLQKVHASFLPNSFGSEPKFEQGLYAQTVQSLSSIYADLYRNLSFLREVIK